MLYLGLMYMQRAIPFNIHPPPPPPHYEWALSPKKKRSMCRHKIVSTSMKFEIFPLTLQKNRKDQRMPTVITPQKLLFSRPSENLIHRGGGNIKWNGPERTLINESLRFLHGFMKIISYWDWSKFSRQETRNHFINSFVIEHRSPRRSKGPGANLSQVPLIYFILYRVYKKKRNHLIF